MKSYSTDDCLDEKILVQAVTILGQGGVVAFPTETYYGLAVDPFNKEALDKLFSLKERSKKKPILVLIRKVEQLSLITDNIPELYYPLIKKYWPGPLTLIFKAGKMVNSLLTGDSGTVGVRISPHPVALQLCKAWDNPITATSANISGMHPAKNPREVIDYFGKDVDFVIDGGTTPAEACSTIISCKENDLLLVRQGLIDFQMILDAEKGN